MNLEASSHRRLRVLGVPFACCLALLLAVDRPAQGQDPFGEVVEVRTGFARVTVADETDRPQGGDFLVSWKRTPQNVREVLGGPGSPIEIGIAIDLSASMHESLDSMRSAVGDFLRSQLSAADRVFVMSFSDRVELVADGRDESLRALATLSSDPRPGWRPTRFFEGLESALSHFDNSSPRAVLLVASDGCDSLRTGHAGERLLEGAADSAIPVVLIAPNRQDCRNTTCEVTSSGQWNCTEAASATTIRVAPRDPFNPTRPPVELDRRFFSMPSPATAARDRFVERLKADRGAFLLARSDSEWNQGVRAVRSLLDRQWTVVFEPSSEKVRSSEVRVKLRGHGRRADSADRTAELRQEQEEAPAVASSPAPSAAEPVAGNPPVIHEQIGVEVVSVDLVATDRRGRRVLDLARDELQLEVDGKARPIDYFSAPRGLAPENVEPLEPPPGVASAPGGTVFLVLDRTTLEARILNQVIGSFRDLVSAPSFAGRTFVVASFADAPILHEPGTSDPDEIHRALDDVGRAGGQGTFRRLERRQLEEEIRSPYPATVELLASEIQALEDREVSRQAAFVAMIQDLVATSADSEEPNTLLIASEGFSAEPERYLKDLWRSVAGLRSELSLSAQDAAPTRHVFLLAELDELAKTLQERRVTAYTLIPTTGSFGSYSPELRTTGGSLRAAPREDLALAEAAANVAKLADSTGGSRIPIFTDLKERIEAVTLDRQASYSLGFTTGPEAGFESHRIRIETTRPGTLLRYRTSYRRLSPPEQRQAALAAAARVGIVNPALPIELRVGSVGNRPLGKGKSRRVPVILDIPLAPLSFRSSLDRSSDLSVLTIQIAVNNSAGTLVLGPEEAIEISIPRAELGQAREDSWSHRVELELSEGRAGVGALVVEKSTGAWATASCVISPED